MIQTYMLPYDPKWPVVCFDEASRQLFGEVRPPQPARRGSPAVVVYEYERKGVCCQLVMCEPLRGWRHVTVTDRRTRQDYAHCIRDLVTGIPSCDQDSVGADDLNTHDGASLYETFRQRKTSDFGQDRVPLHTQTRQLAEHGGNRDQHHGPSMPRPPTGQSKLDGGEVRHGKALESEEGTHPLDLYAGCCSAKTT